MQTVHFEQEGSSLVVADKQLVVAEKQKCFDVEATAELLSSLQARCFVLSCFFSTAFMTYKCGYPGKRG
eukprot:1609987-Amphidinium_carterae.2